MLRRPPRSTRTNTLFPYTTLFRSLATEMPAGTVIGDPKWWADRIARQYRVRSGVAPAASVDLEQFRDATEMWMNLEDREEGSRLLDLIASAGGAKGDDESADYY